MLYRLFILSFFLSFFCLFLQAQSNIEDVVYLKNGGMVRGNIIELLPDSILKIQTKDRNIFVYKFNEIQKIIREQTPAIKKDSIVKKDIVLRPAIKDSIVKRKFRESGYFAMIKFGPGNASSNYHVINGYQLNPYLSLGFGVGLDVYVQLGDSLDFTPYNGGSHSRLKDYFMPMFVDLRCYMKGKSRATLVTFMDIGYSAYLGGKTNDKIYTSSNTNVYGNHNSSYGSFKPVSGGTFLYTGLGVRIFITKRIAVITDLGLKIQTYVSKQFNSANFNGIPTPNSTQTRGIMVAYTPAINIGVIF